MLLTFITFLPLVGALAIAATPRLTDRQLRLAALGFTGIVAVLSVVIFLRFDGTSAAAQFGHSAPWFTLPGGVAVSYTLGVDGLSILMVALTGVLMPLVVVSTKGHIHTRVKEFVVWLLVMETGMLGVFLSLDLVLFYFFWEISLIPLYFIIGIWGGERRLYATIKPSDFSGCATCGGALNRHCP